MLVRELVAVLAKLPQDLPILIQGYESGLCDVAMDKIKEVRYHKDGAGGAYSGPHGLHDAADLSCYYCPMEADQAGPTEPAILIER